MSRLPRPRIPLGVRLTVAWRQIGFGSMASEMSAYAVKHRMASKTWAGISLALAKKLGCGAAGIHLDHDPALQNRQKVYKRGIHVGYRPDANDPDYLVYRAAADHKTKTLVRGDHGQHSDAALARKRKRRERKRASKSRPKVRMPKRKLRSANRWPPRGSQKIRSRR